VLGGVAVILAAKNIAAVICFFIGRTVAADTCKRLLKNNKHFKALQKTNQSSGWQLVLAMRLSPMPSYVVSYGSSILNVPFASYMRATLVASAPFVVQNVYMGSLLEKVEDIWSGKAAGGGVADLAKYVIPTVGTVGIVLWTKQVHRPSTRTRTCTCTCFPGLQPWSVTGPIPFRPFPEAGPSVRGKVSLERSGRLQILVRCHALARVSARLSAGLPSRDAHHGNPPHPPIFPPRPRPRVPPRPREHSFRGMARAARSAVDAEVSLPLASALAARLPSRPRPRTRPRQRQRQRRPGTAAAPSI
jgi:membrane protein DedA with SNARE-associated domain